MASLGPTAAETDAVIRATLLRLAGRMEATAREARQAAGEDPPNIPPQALTAPDVQRATDAIVHHCGKLGIEVWSPAFARELAIAALLAAGSLATTPDVAAGEPAKAAPEAIYAAALAVRRRNCHACTADLRECDCTPDVDDLADAATALEAAGPHLAAAEQERWLTVLAGHYLMGINCDEATKQDNPLCGCSRVFLGWHSSIGAARQAWIDHVTEVLREAQP